MNNTYTSIEQFNREFFPSMVLERLEKRVCENLGLEGSVGHRLSKSEKDINEGSLEFVKSKFFRIDNIRSLVENFYSKEGYKVKRYKDTLKLRKGKKVYDLHIIDSDNDFSIYISKAIFD